MPENRQEKVDVAPTEDGAAGRHMRLQRRLKLTLLATVLAIIAVLVWASAQVLQLERAQSDRERLRSQQVLWDSIIDSHTRELMLMASQLAEDDYLLKAVDTQSQQVSDIADESFELLHDAVFTGMCILAHNGQVLFDSRQETRRASSALLLQALRTDQVQQGVEQLPDGRATLSVVVPLRRHGRLVGALRLDSDLSAALRKISALSGHASYLVDAHGRRLLGTPAALFQALSPALGPARALSQDIALNERWYRVISTPVGGTHELAGIRLLSVDDTTAAMARQQDIRDQAWLAAAVLIALLIALQYLYLHRVFAPLARLRDTVYRFGRGETWARTGFGHQDEIGELGRGFDDMARRIEESLEQERVRNDQMQLAVQDMLAFIRQLAQGDFSAPPRAHREHPILRELTDALERMRVALARLLGEIQDISLQLEGSARLLAETTRNQHASAQEQAASSRQVSQLANRIGHSSRQLVESVEQVAVATGHSAAKAGNGRKVLMHLEDTGRNIGQATQRIGERLASLDEKAEKIHQVVDLINRVADQTNLLSLNAAIEAEKAGRYGLGFAVVATEIRHLADQTAVATWDIGQIASEIQAAVGAAVVETDKFHRDMQAGNADLDRAGNCLAGIIAQVSELAPHVEQLQAGIRSHAEHAGSIAECVEELHQAAAGTADAATESGQVAGGLQRLAARLRELAMSLQLEQSIRTQDIATTADKS